MDILMFPFIKHATILLTLLYASYIDFKVRSLENHRIIYVPLIFFGINSFIMYPWWIVLPSTLFAFAFGYTLYKIKRIGLGGADVKIFTLLGACYPISFIFIIFYSGLASCAFGVFLIWKIGFKHAMMMRLPYIPFIAIGTIGHDYLFVFGI